MPFLARSSDGSLVLFFCRADPDYVWKLHYLANDGTARLIRTGMNSDTIECSPAAWHDDDGWHLSFTAGGSRHDRRYRLYRMDGPSLGRLARPIAIHPTRWGFVAPGCVVYGRRPGHVYVSSSLGCSVFELPGVSLWRLSYGNGDPQNLLITGLRMHDREIFTLEYNPRTGAQSLIECDGQPAYKCTTMGEMTIYAARCGASFEDRRLVKAHTVDRTPVRLVDHRHVLQSVPDQVFVSPDLNSLRRKPNARQD